MLSLSVWPKVIRLSGFYCFTVCYVLKDLTVYVEVDYFDEWFVDPVVGLAHQPALVLLAGVLDEEGAVGEEPVVPVYRTLVVQLHQGAATVRSVICEKKDMVLESNSFSFFYCNIGFVY